MKRIMAVYDVDPFYADKFAEFANRKEKTPFTAIAFTSISRLKGYTEQQPVELLLVGDEVGEEELEALSVGQTIRLSETGIARTDGIPVVYKYQPSDLVLREVMACYQVEAEYPLLIPTGKNCTIIGIYSPIHRCGKTGFALTMGQILAKDSNVLYLSLEENSSLQYLIEGEHRSSLSDLLYYYRQGKYNRLRLSTIVHTLHELSYIPPVTYAEDLAEVTGKELEGLITAIAGDGGYDIILLDLGQFGRGIEILLELCQVIYMPTKEDCISKAKLEVWKNYLATSKRGHLWERIKQLKLPCQEGGQRLEPYLEQLLWGEMGDYVRALLRGQETEIGH